MTPSVTDRVSEADLAQIKAGLAASEPDPGPYSPAPLAVLLHDPHGTLVGGLIGHSIWQWLSIRLLWVDPAHRGAGHGRRLLAAAEAEGRARGCRHARLNTFSFQAAGFYERCGYRQVLALDDFPQGHQRLFYVKALGDTPDAARVEMPRTLRTGRLLLRLFGESDLDALARLYADPHFMRYIGPVADRDDAWRHLAMLIGHWQLRGYGLWAVEYQGGIRRTDRPVLSRGLAGSGGRLGARSRGLGPGPRDRGRPRRARAGGTGARPARSGERDPPRQCRLDPSRQKARRAVGAAHNPAWRRGGDLPAPLRRLAPRTRGMRGLNRPPTSYHN
jgi:GNAT superfamily N-acetyltransferase